MPSLPFVCIECGRTYRTVEVSRTVLPGERAAGLCPEHLRSLDMRLFGGIALPASIDPLYCGCGRQLITPRQHVAGRCEFCQTRGTVREAVYV